MESRVIIGIEDDKLMHRMTIRILCDDERAENVAISIAVTLLEIAEHCEVKPIFKYIPESGMVPKAKYSKVSFSVLYKDDKAKEKFLKFLKT